MNKSVSPYLRIPSDLAVVNRLMFLKGAASSYGCSADTLKNNAKARNLKAYQDSPGAPVFVLPEDVEEFLKMRPAVASVFHPPRGAQGSPSCEAVSSSPSNEDGVAHLSTLRGRAEGKWVADLPCFREASLAEVAFAARFLAEMAKALTNLGGDVRARDSETSSDD